jgi:ABC-type bacteriocin/lantibiotic exporter with double-glycine peptidase domain
MLRRVCRAAIVMLLCCSVVAAAEFPGIWIDVPFVKQEKDACGAASIAMVMQYWQRQQGLSGNPNAEVPHIQYALLSHGAHGIYASDMERYFQQNGFSTFAFAGDWDTLKHHLEKGRPLIVCLKPGSHLPLHYVVVAGLDQEGQLVLLNDPAQRKLLKENYSNFEQEWKAAGRWTLLVLPGPSSH